MIPPNIVSKIVTYWYDRILKYWWKEEESGPILLNLILGIVPEEQKRSWIRILVNYCEYLLPKMPSLSLVRNWCAGKSSTQEIRDCLSRMKVVLDELIFSRTPDVKYQDLVKSSIDLLSVIVQTTELEKDIPVRECIQIRLEFIQRTAECYGPVTIPLVDFIRLHFQECPITEEGVRSIVWSDEIA